MSEVKIERDVYENERVSLKMTETDLRTCVRIVVIAHICPEKSPQFWQRKRFVYSIRINEDSYRLLVLRAYIMHESDLHGNIQR